MMSFGMNKIVIIGVKRFGYHSIIHGYHKSELVNFLEKSVLGGKGSV